MKPFKGNMECKVVTVESLENPYVIPLLMNCKVDNPELISSRVPLTVQDNATFIIDLDSLANRKDVFSDDNGAWLMKGNRVKFYSLVKDSDGQVTSLERVSAEDSADIFVRRRPYICKSCPEFHKTIVSIEYGKEVEKWFPLVLVHYYFEGEPRKFAVTAHGNRKAGSAPLPPYTRTKESTKSRLTQNISEGKNNPKKALFKTIKETGGVCAAESSSSLPRNVRQAKHIKQRLGLTSSSTASKSSIDPLMAVLELQKSTFAGFIREVVCNDLPTIMLFTDQQVDDMVRFCCHNRASFVSELGVDVTFQLGPFYLVVTTYKNTVLRVKGTNHSPCFLGPVMMCMTKEESTYLSFIHCLLRTVPGLGQFLHATGTDNETALRNAVSAEFYRSHPLLCYLHSKKNVKEKARQLGLSQSLTARILEDLYARKSGLVWSSSKEEFDTRVQGLLQEWETLESSERKGPAKFGDYFCQFKLEDMRERMSKYVMEGLGLGEEPYIQNIPESVNSMIKEWNNFVPKDLDQFVLSLYDFVESFQMEAELAWFGLSQKWEVHEMFQQHMPKQAYGEMSVEERKTAIKQANKVSPDPEAYKRCKGFKFTHTPSCSSLSATSPLSSSSFTTVSSDKPNHSESLAALGSHFSREELSVILEKAKALLHNKSLREGFQAGSFLIDSGLPLPYKVQFLKSGKCSCSCSFFGRNSICHHCVAVGIHTGCLEKMVSSFPGRSLTKVSVSSTPKSVGSKAPPRKRQRQEEVTPSQNALEEKGEQFTAQPISDTALVIRKSSKPSDPPPTAPLILKTISGGIRKCAGCQKALSSVIEGYDECEDKHYCFGRFEAYNFWNKTSQRYQSTASTRHYHLNPVCTRVQQSQYTLKILPGSVDVTYSLRELIRERFSYSLV